MAGYLALKLKTSGATYAGRALITVDEAICEHLGVQVDDIDFVNNWVDRIGFCLVMREGYALAHEQYDHMPNMKSIVDFLEANYINESYHMR